MATTGLCDSAKVEIMSAAHCFLSTVSGASCTGVNTQFTLTGLANTTGIGVGMVASGVNVAAGAVVASVDSASQVTLSKAHTGAVNSVTFTADVFRVLLINGAPSRTYDHTQTNVGTPGAGSPSTSNVGTDEVSGSGYTSGGFTLTNIGPSLPGNPSTTATVTFSPNPNWVLALFTASAAIVYNSSARLGASAAPLSGRAFSVHDFGGAQTVTNGTFTILLPVNDGSNAILRIA
jgi:hypothetical protein